MMIYCSNHDLDAILRFLSLVVDQMYYGCLLLLAL